MLLAGALVVAIVATGGAIYFGAATQQASAATKMPVSARVILDESAKLTKEEKAAFAAVVTSMNNLQKVTSSPNSKIKRYVEIGGYCFVKEGRTYTPVSCL